MRHIPPSPPDRRETVEGLVSVILPTYNRADKVGRAIESVLDQSYDRLELLVIDDCSTDHTVDVLEAASRSDERVRTIYLEENVGLREVRNPGLESARGEFIAFIDSDDAWLPWKTDAQLEVFRRLPDVGMCWTDMIAIDRRGEEVYPRYLRRMYAAYGERDEDDFFEDRIEIDLPEPEATTADVRFGDIYRWMFWGNIVHTPTVMVRRSHISEHQRFDLPHYVGEDHAFHLNTARQTRAALLDVPAIRYQIGEADQVTSGEHGEEYARAYLAVLEREVDRYGDDLPIDADIVDAAFAKANEWLASEILHEDPEQARKLLLRSIRLRPRLDRRLKLLLLSLLPQRVGHTVVAWRAGLNQT